MTQRRPLTERVRELQHAHDGQHRALALVAQEGQRTTEQTEALMRDHRDTRRIVQDVEARLLVVAGTQGEMLSVLRDMSDELAAIRAAVTVGSKTDAELRAGVESAKRKASGATHKAVALEARQSKTEEQIARALADAAAKYEAAKQETDRRIAAAIEKPPVGAELADLQREVLKGAKPLAGKLGLAVMALLIAACVYGAAAFTSCSPGGFP